MKLPLLISVPHSGLTVPPEVEPYCILTQQEIVEDGDEGAAEVYHGLRGHVVAFVTTPIARAIVDMNRAEGDRRPDGVVKTHTCWNVPVYGEFPPRHVIERLLNRYYRPYHTLLTELSRSGVRLGLDCHTMAAEGPPIGPGPGIERPRICLANGDGTCPRDWVESLADCLVRVFDHEVAINHPFQGGYIIRAHAGELPWAQLELSRALFLSHQEKHARVLAALCDWCNHLE